MAVPDLVVSFLLGAPITEHTGIFISRLAGVALISLAIACWYLRSNGQEASGIIKAVLFYNIAAAVVLVFAFLNGFSGLGIWPASLLHIGMATWCLKFLVK